MSHKLVAVAARGLGRGEDGLFDHDHESFGVPGLMERLRLDEAEVDGLGSAAFGGHDVKRRLTS
jgi:hypothetical protein